MPRVIKARSATTVEFHTVHSVVDNTVIHSTGFICHVIAGRNRRCDLYSWFLHNNSNL